MCACRQLSRFNPLNTFSVNQGLQGMGAEPQKGYKTEGHVMDHKPFLQVN